MDNTEVPVHRLTLIAPLGGLRPKPDALPGWAYCMVGRESSRAIYGRPSEG
jgi:hypothetical protein